MSPAPPLPHSFYRFLKIYFFLERGEGGKKRERNIDMWLPLVCPPLGTWPTTQACALTGNWTSDPMVRRPTLNPLSHTSQGHPHILKLNSTYFLVWREMSAGGNGVREEQRAKAGGKRVVSLGIDLHFKITALASWESLTTATYIAHHVCSQVLWGALETQAGHLRRSLMDMPFWSTSAGGTTFHVK